MSSFEVVFTNYKFKLSLLTTNRVKKILNMYQIILLIKHQQFYLNINIKF